MRSEPRFAPTAFALLVSIPFSMFGCSASHSPNGDPGGDAGALGNAGRLGDGGGPVPDGNGDCVPCEGPPPNCRYLGGSCTHCGELICEDCTVDCAPPAPNCRYTGPFTCDPPSCGELLCEPEDAGQCVTCPPPPPGCRYEGSDCTTCGELLCECQEEPAFDDVCMTAEECAIGLRNIDCCGSEEAIGIRASELDLFMEHAAECAPHATCACAAQPVLTETGPTTADPSQVVVLCLDNHCTTTGPPFDP